MKNIFKYLLLGALCVCLSGCTKTALGIDDFKGIMTVQECKVDDLSEDYLNNDNIEFMAEAECGGFTVEYYDLKDNDVAKDIFDNEKEEIQTYLSGTYKEYEKNFKTYHMYKLVNQGKYQFIAIIDNTAVYINTSDENESAANEIIKKLGY